MNTPLQRIESFAQSALDAMIEHICVVDGSGKIVAVNSAWRLFAEANNLMPELVSEGVNYLDICDRVHDKDAADAERFAAGIRDVAAGRVASFSMEYACHSPTVQRWFVARISRFKDINPIRIVIAHDNITERTLQQQRLVRLSRMHAMLSDINSLIVRVRDRSELLNSACRVAVERGGFRLAWIGMIRGETLQPIAQFGIDNGYVEDIQISVQANHLHGNGPSAQSMRSGAPIACNDIENDAMMSPWREAALGRGYRASLAVPIRDSGRVVGCLNLYSGDRNFFDNDETRLVLDLSKDISYALEFIALDERLDYLCLYDPVTGMANRALLIERFDQHINEARDAGGHIAIFKFDLSRFKAINDVIGHPGGDQIFRLIAERMAAYVSNKSLVGRIEGDRLVLLVLDSKKAPFKELIQEQVGAIQKHLTQPISLLGQEFRINTKVGVAIFPDHGDDAEALIMNAGAALRAAKSTSEPYQVYKPEMSASTKVKLSLERKLRQAIERDEFVLHYQPKVDVLNGKINGAEALIRWNDPELGQIPPISFIPLLEETGMIIEVGAWVLRQAAKDQRAWLDEGISVPPIAVNVSPLQLRKSDFVQIVESVLTCEGPHKPKLELEVTETMLMTDIESAIDKLGRIRAMGVPTAIDDFGTGYSSLSYLARLPISTIKIDRSFIIQMLSKAEMMTIVSSIISLAHSMHLKVVAEGVDSVEQLNTLRSLNCDEIQGFLFSKPISAHEFRKMLIEDRRFGDNYV